MKLVLFLVFSFCAVQTYCQKPSPIKNSLQKYSYTLMAFSNKPLAGFGTCFFINRNNKIYLITAKHVLYHCDAASHMSSPAKYGIVFIDMMNPLQFPLAPREESCYQDLRDTDLLVIRMDQLKVGDVNTVETLILPPFKKLGDAEIYGQGLQHDSLTLHAEAPHHIHLVSNTFKVSGYNTFKDPPAVDTLHYYFDLEKFQVKPTIKGFSGSPIFVQDAVSKRYRLCGILAMANTYEQIKKQIKGITGVLIAIKPELITKRIDEMQKSNKSTF